MKNKILIYSLFILISSCNSQDSPKADNILLGDEVRITYVEELVKTQRPGEWLYGLDRDKLIKLIYKQVLENNQPIYTSDNFFFTEERMAKEEVIESMEKFDTPWETDQIQQILFNETWDASSDLESFTKRVDDWCPVRVFHPNPNTDEIYKRIEFSAKPNANTRGELVAESVFLEFELAQLGSFFPMTSGLDADKFISKVLGSIQSGKKAAYDPIYLVDKTLKTFSVEELTEFVEMDLNSVLFRKQIETIIFEENWYFDGESMNIAKEVLSLGFVRKYYEGGENKSKILFFLKFE